MVVKVGTGFGRIGRLARRIQKRRRLVTRINAYRSSYACTLLKYDTTQGRFDGTVEVKEGGSSKLTVNSLSFG